MRFCGHFLFAILFFLSCEQAKKEKKADPSPAGYDFNEAEKTSLPEDLDEISGIVNDSAGRLVAINDEEGVLYRFLLSDLKQLEDYRFHKGADFEETISVSPYWYALKSNGTLYRISNAFSNSPEVKSYQFPPKGQHEFEAMLHDQAKNRILIFCKICGKVPAAEPEVFAFDLSTETYDSVPVFKISLNPVQQEELGKNSKLQISGAAVHPVSGDWYFVASASGVLITTDHSGKCTQLIKLGKKQFKQPEGICFAPNGDMFISNEAKTGIANVLRFKIK